MGASAGCYNLVHIRRIYYLPSNVRCRPHTNHNEYTVTIQFARHQSRLSGPPFSIPLAEVKRLYGGKLGYRVEMLSSDDARKDYQVLFKHTWGKWAVLQYTEPVPDRSQNHTKHRRKRFAATTYTCASKAPTCTRHLHTKMYHIMHRACSPIYPPLPPPHPHSLVNPPPTRSGGPMGRAS